MRLYFKSRKGISHNYKRRSVARSVQNLVEGQKGKIDKGDNMKHKGGTYR